MDAMPPSLRWYALYTKPRCERVVSRRLRAKGFETYLPAITMKGSRGRTLKRPFFPRYLFVRLDLDTDGLSSVRWTPGLKYVVSFDDKPAVVPDQVIALIQERMATLGQEDGLRQGDKVKGRPFDKLRTTQGAKETFSSSPPLPLSLSQIEAVFEGTLRPDERAVVLIDFLGRMSKVRRAVEDLEPA